MYILCLKCLHVTGGGQKKEQKCKNRNSYKMLREQLKREKSNYPNSWFDNISCN